MIFVWIAELSAEHRNSPRQTDVIEIMAADEKSARVLANEEMRKIFPPDWTGRYVRLQMARKTNELLEGYQATAEAAAKRVSALEAENEQLRAALTDVDENHCGCLGGSYRRHL